MESVYTSINQSTYIYIHILYIWWHGICLFFEFLLFNGIAPLKIPMEPKN